MRHWQAGSSQASRAPLFSALSGALFAVGLALSGMTDPAKVQAFLDVTGAWDPSLASVMAGAVAFHALWLRFADPYLSKIADAPSSPVTRIDARLVVGAAIFGVGWGLAGYCPGPALVAAAQGRADALWFVLALVSGMLLHRALDNGRRANVAAPDASRQLEPAQN